MSKDIEQARQDILKILLGEYGLKTLENFEENIFQNKKAKRHKNKKNTLRINIISLRNLLT